MQQEDKHIIENAKSMLQAIKVASQPYEALTIAAEDVEPYSYLTHTREWLNMAVEMAAKAETFDKAIVTSKNSTQRQDCARLRDNYLADMKIYINRAIKWYQKYLALKGNDVMAITDEEQAA